VTVGVLVGFCLLRRLMPLKSLFSPTLLSSNVKKQALRYSSIVAGMLVLGYLVSQEAEVFFIGAYCPVEDVGFYSLAYRIGSFLKVFPVSFAFVLLPVMAEQFGSQEMQKLKRIYHVSSRYLMLLVLPLAVGGIVLADSIINVIYGVDYRPVIIIFQIICLPIAISSMTGAGDAVIRGVNRPGFLLITQAIVSVINIGLSLLFIPKYGVIGATAVSSMSMALFFPAYIIFINKKLGAGWPVRDTIKIAIASTIMGIVVYVIHSHLGAALSLVLCIPLGVVLYLVAIFAFKVIQEEDLTVLRGIQDSLPSILRKYYVFFLTLMEKIVVKKKVTIE
jgi:O-antigen/teichoic acid export membrane protein